MNRKALLIGSPTTTNFLSGVQTDIENMHEYLMSPLGGAWLASEIEVLHPNPSVFEVQHSLQECSQSDLSFVYFSGHGATDKYHRQIVQLNNEEYMLVDTLANQAPRQITIVDACRNYTESNDYSNFTGQGQTLSGLELPEVDFLLSRNSYETFILNVPPPQRLLIQAVERGESAIDKGKRHGGLFSSTLLKVINKAAKKGDYEPLNAGYIFSEVKRVMKQQNPQIEILHGENISLPLAVDVPKKKEGLFSKKYLPYFAGVGIVLLILALIYRKD